MGMGEFPALRHLLPVHMQILRTGHVPEKIVQNLCAGQPRQVPENLCERCAGASKNDQRLCTICAGGVEKCAEIVRKLCGGAPAQFSQNIGVGLPRMCVHKFGRREKTPTPKTRFSSWTLLRTPGRFTTRPLPVHFTTKMSVVRPFSVLSKDEIGL